MFSFLKWNELHGPVTKALIENINQLLQSQPIDDSIKSMEIKDIDFGRIPPTLDILDISEPPEEIRGRRGEEIFRRKTSPQQEGRRKRKSYSSYGLASVLNNMASTGNKDKSKTGGGGRRIRRQKSNPFSSSAQRLSDVNELKKFYSQYPQRICSFKKSHPRFERRNRELRGMYNPFSERREIEEEIWRCIDVQIKTFFSYVGNLKISISTVFQLNEPVKNFLEVPLHVTVSHVKIAFLCVVIYRGGKDQVEIYINPSPLTKYFDLAIELGDENDVFVDENLIGDFLKKNIDLFLEERLIFPNRIRINGLANCIEEEIRVVMEKMNFKSEKDENEGKFSNNMGRKSKRSRRLRRRRRRRRKKKRKRFVKEEEEEEEEEDEKSHKSSTIFFSKILKEDEDEDEGESDDDDDDDSSSSCSSSDSDWVGRRRKKKKKKKE